MKYRTSLKRNSRRSQMEIMGLAIIIILVSLGFLFVVKFVILKPNDNIKKDYTFTQMASNELNAMLKSTTATCKGTDITELLQDCATSQSIICDDGVTDSCAYAKQTIEYMLTNTLSEWKKMYELEVTVGDDIILSASDGVSEHIRNNYERQTKIFPIPLDSGTMIVKLMIYG